MLQRFRVDDPVLFDQIVARLAAGLDRAGWGGPGLLSVTLAVPEIPFDSPPGALGRGFWWSRPAARHNLLGSGAAATVEARGTERWAQLRAAFGGWQSDWRHADIDGTGLLPVALGGFAFAPGDACAELPAARLSIPELLLRRQDDATVLTFSFAGGDITAAMASARGALRRLVDAFAVAPSVAGPTILTRRGDTPGEAAWLARVHAAVTDIQSGRLDKVVLSRRVSLKAARALDPSRIMAELARRHPRCTLFAVPSQRDGVLLGASPELLVGLRHGEAYCDALAGTAWGPTGGPEQAGLLADVKNGREHRLVVQALEEGLRPVCSRLEVPVAPVTCHFGQLHHLRSVLRGRARSGVGLLELAERLHPTPAVGGYPRQAALEWLAAHGEQRDGWYTGAVGWIDRAGEGEFAVALRCANIRGSRADLYAGAGIVAGSDARLELAETDAKLAVMLDALERSGGEA